MKKNFRYLLLVIILFSCSCTSVDDDNREIVSRSPIVSIVDVTRTAGIVSVYFWASWQNGCGRFSHYTQEGRDSVYTFTIYGKQQANAACTQAIIKFMSAVHLTNLSPGTYTFKFWSTDSTTVDTTVSL